MEMFHAPNLCLLLAFLWAFAVTGSYPLTAEEKKENSQIDIKLKQNARSENKATRVIVNSVKVEKQTKLTINGSDKELVPKSIVSTILLSFLKSSSTSPHPLTTHNKGSSAI